MKPIVSICTAWQENVELIDDYEAVARWADEVVVVDNASSHDAALEIRAMVERLGGVYLRNEVSGWFGPAMNHAIRALTGDIVVALNNDVAAASDRKANWVERVREEVRDGSLYGPMVCQRSDCGMCFQYVVSWCCAATHRTWDRLGGFDDAPTRFQCGWTPT